LRYESIRRIGTASQTPTRTPCILAEVVLITTRLRPHREIMDPDVDAWGAARADDVDGTSSEHDEEDKTDRRFKYRAV
jgi:hypothetical protein